MRPGRKWRDALLAVGVGLGVATFVWLALAQPADSIANFFLERSLPEGGGSNVVNVIIVDFRAFDTLGEITVMAVAAFIVHALLSEAKAGGSLRGSARIDAPPLMLQLASQWILPFAVLVSLHLFVRGHNLPGGGFIAGLVLALGFMLQAVAHGLGWMEERTRFDYRLWIGWGLLIAGGIGIASGFVGSPFLTSTYDYPWLPGIGGVPLASAAVFDLGVYLVVTGATLLLLLTIARFGREEVR